MTDTRPTSQRVRQVAPWQACLAYLDGCLNKVSKRRLVTHPSIRDLLHHQHQRRLMGVGLSSSWSLFVSLQKPRELPGWHGQGPDQPPAAPPGSSVTRPSIKEDQTPNAFWMVLAKSRSASRSSALNASIEDDLNALWNLFIALPSSRRFPPSAGFPKR